MSDSRSKRRQTPFPMSTKPSSNNKQVALLAQAQYTSGPLPSPEIMQGYEKVVLGAAERILQMAEKQQSHRMGEETKMIDSEIADSKRGMVFAFILCILALAVSAMIAVFSKSTGGYVVACIVGSSSLWNVIGQFIYQRWHK